MIFVIYNSSPVYIEALFFGIPVVFVDLGEYINSDPLFDFDIFKWKVKSPEQFSGTVEYINNIPEDEYLKMQKKATEYAHFYFEAVTEQKLKLFYK